MRQAFLLLTRRYCFLSVGWLSVSSLAADCLHILALLLWWSSPSTIRGRKSSPEFAEVRSITANSNLALMVCSTFESLTLWVHSYFSLLLQTQLPRSRLLFLISIPNTRKLPKTSVQIKTNLLTHIIWIQSQSNTRAIMSTNLYSNKNNPATTLNSSNDNHEGQSVVEVCAEEVFSKLKQLDQLIEQLQNEELSIREKLRITCQDLKNEVEEIESKQRKITECLRNVSAQAQ